MDGKVVKIFIAPKKEDKPRSVRSIEVIAHRGLVGDRYYMHSGTFSDAEPRGPGREITLIEEENVDLLAEHAHRIINPGDLRRNLVTRGFRLNEFVGKEFMVGDLRLRGVRLCHPCKHLERLCGLDVIAALKGKGGLRADILDSGWLRVGDIVNSQPGSTPETSG